MSLLVNTLRNSEMYMKEDVAWFFSSKDPRYELSNMATGFIIQYNSLVWKSSEHLYQASKYGVHAVCIPDSAKGEVEANVQERIRLAKTPMAAKMTQKCAVSAGLVRPDWEEQCIKNMLYVLELKLFENREMQDIYNRTGTQDIVEISSKDSFWGCLQQYSQKGTKLIGMNVLGKLHMDVRSRIDSISKGDFKAPDNFFI